jgi:hypothetical protein
MVLRGISMPRHFRRVVTLTHQISSPPPPKLLRLKCEAYSTLNDTDEDSITEARLSVRMREAGHLVPPPATLVAPAALYLTAVLEHVCEYVLFGF